MKVLIATIVVLGGSVLVVGLLVLARAVGREHRTRRDEPRDRPAERARRYELRNENVKVVRSMLLGRWADDPQPRSRRGSLPKVDDESDP